MSTQSPLRLITFCALALSCLGTSAHAQQSLAKVISTVQPRMVKLYGAGGVQGLEAYQSAFLISNEGHILTAWSYVLDADVITATLDDGRRLTPELYDQMLIEELKAIREEIGAERYDSGRFPLASDLFTQMAKAEPFVEFLTLPAYAYL